MLTRPTARASTQTATRWRATLNSFPRLATSFRDRGYSIPKFIFQVYFPDLEVGFALGNNPRLPAPAPARGSAGQRGAVLGVDQQRAQGPRPAQAAPKFLKLQPAHSPCPLPPQPSTPAAAATLSSLQRGQTIFPYESSHSLLDRFYNLGSKFSARRPHSIFDVLSPTPSSDTLFSGCTTTPCALRTPSGANHAALHPPLPLLSAFISTLRLGWAPFSPRAPRTRPPFHPRVSGAS